MVVDVVELEPNCKVEGKPEQAVQMAKTVVVPVVLTEMLVFQTVSVAVVVVKDGMAGLVITVAAPLHGWHYTQIQLGIPRTAGQRQGGLVVAAGVGVVEAVVEDTQVEVPAVGHMQAAAAGVDHLTRELIHLSRVLPTLGKAK